MTIEEFMFDKEQNGDAPLMIEWVGKYGAHNLSLYNICCNTV